MESPGLTRGDREGWLYVRLVSFLFSILCSLSSFVNLHAQQYNIDVTSYTWEDGLPHRQINATAIDQEGFLWIATRAGVSRFDGHDFKNWSKLDGGLVSNEIGRVAVDTKGYVWAIAMPSYQFHIIGINLIDPVSGDVKDFSEVYDYQWPVPFNQLSGFHYDSEEGALYFGVKNPSGILSFHADRGFDFQRFPLETDIQSLLGRTREGIWWASTRDDITIGVGPDDEYRQIPYELNSAIAVTNHHMPDEVAWIGNDDGLVQLNWAGEGFQVKHYPAPEGQYQVEALLIGLGDLVPGYKREDQWKHFEQQTIGLLEVLFRDYATVGDFYIKHVLVEEKGRVWLSTDNGLVQIKWSQPVFRRWPQNAATFATSVRDMMLVQDSQLLVVLEEEGLFSLNPYTLEDEKIYDVAEKGVMVALAPTPDDGFLFSIDHEIFLGRLGQPARKRVSAGSKVWAIFPDFGEDYLIGTESGLRRFNLANNTLVDFDQYNGFVELSTIQTNFITRTESGEIWLCTTTGLYQLDLQTGIKGRYWTGGEGDFYLPDNNIYHLYEDEDGLFWIATGGGGLICWHPEKGVQQQLTRADGLAADFVYATYEDKEGKLWLPTDFGLTLMDKANREVLRTFLPKDGLTYHEFNRRAYYRLPDGTILFGTLAGLNIFHPGDLYRSSGAAPPQMRLTAYTQFDASEGKLVNRFPDLVRDGQITLNPNDRFARLEFVLLSFEKQVRVRYAYRLEPAEQDWTYQEERTLRLGQLPYGGHTLVIKGQAPDGEWSPYQLEIPVLVLRPFYLQWWFILICIAVVAIGVLLFFRYRTWRYRLAAEQLQTAVDQQTQKIQEQTEELKQLDRLKSRLFANVSHELRTPLTMVLGPVSSLLNDNQLTAQQRHLLSHAQQNGKDLLRLINNILELARMDAAKLELKAEPLQLYYFLKTIISNFESYANRLQVSLVLNYRLATDLTLMVDADKLDTIVRNYLSNALKYTPAGGQIVVQLKEEEGQIVVAVKDNGNGIAAEDLPYVFDRFFQSKQADKATSGGTGIGLALCAELARVMDGNTTVESTLGEGSTFTFRFPRQQIMGVVEPADNGAKSAYLSTKKPTGVEKVVPPSDTSKPQLLIVEDSLSIQDYLQFLLSEKYQLEMAFNGEEALQLLGRHRNGEPNREIDSPFRPDLILSDVMMPRMDGIELVGILKSQADLAPVPVVLLTALAEQESKLTSLRIGVDDYLLKPFDEDELQIRITNALKNFALRKNTKASEVPGRDELPDEANSSPRISKEDQAFLRQLELHIEELMASPNLNLDYISGKLFLSRRQLQRRIRALTGLSPNAYLKEARLVKARGLLEQRRTSSVKATAIAVGIKDVNYFSRLFRDRFGRLPSSYL